MSEIDDGWPRLGRTDNATIYAAHRRVLVVAPDDGSTDDESTALQSLDFQRSYWSREQTTGTTIILMDLVGHQTKGARHIYQTKVDTERTNGFALVTRSLFGRAVASVYMGLARPPVLTRMFAELAAALAWAHDRNDEVDGR